MPLNAFAANQTVIFQVVSRHVEESWDEKTVCTRILMQDGTEAEVQATRDAIPQWETLPKDITHSMVVTRACLKPYRGQEKTGIVSSSCVRVAYANRSLQRATT